MRGPVLVVPTTSRVLASASNDSATPTGASLTRTTSIRRVTVLERSLGRAAVVTWKVTVRWDVLGSSLVLLYRTSRSAVW